MKSKSLVRSNLALLQVARLVALGGCSGGQGPVVTVPPSTKPFDAVETSRRQSQDGKSASRVVEYLAVHASGGPWRSGPDFNWSHDPGLAAYLVALINRALPHDRHLIVGADGQWEQPLPDIPDGQLFVEFVDAPPQGRRPGSEALAHLDVETEYDAVRDRWEKMRLRTSSVELDREFFRGRPDHQAVSVLVHEMLHSLGLQRHFDAPAFQDSNMYDAWFRLDGSLPAIDAAGIQALYARLGEETEPEDLSASSLGAWSRQTVHLNGEFDDIAFRVRQDNGVSMPWPPGPSLLQSSWPTIVQWSGRRLGQQLQQPGAAPFDRLVAGSAGACSREGGVTPPPRGARFRVREGVLP